ncbi:MAG: hypothetical protein AB8B62_10435 [Roseobacter sp.]
MENKKIIHLYKLEIPKADLERLSVDEVAFIATMAFAVDELSVFQKLLIQTFNARPSDDDMSGMYQTQQNCLLRVLIAKSFETLKIVENFKRTMVRKSKSDRLQVLTQFEEDLANFQHGELYLLAKDIRNHSVSHYIPPEVSKNLQDMGSYPQFSAFLHENSGNSYHPFGEEAAFLARIGRHFREAGRDKWSVEDFRDLTDWTLSVSSLNTKIFQRYLLWLHKEFFPDWRLTPLKPYLEQSQYAKADEAILPIFLAADQLR